MKRERIEDLGVIKEKLDKLLEDQELFRLSQSKHTIELFIEKYQSNQNLEDLHNQLRFLEEKLWEIYSIANGDYEFDDSI